MFLRISSTSFGGGERIPEKHARNHASLSPPLAWRGAPRETQSLVLVVEDEDAPHGRFRLAALDVPYLTIEPAERAKMAWRTEGDDVLKQAELVGTYER